MYYPSDVVPSFGIKIRIIPTKELFISIDKVNPKSFWWDTNNPRPAINNNGCENELDSSFFAEYLLC